MMPFRVIKLVGIFCFFVTAVVLYKFSAFFLGTSSYSTKLFQERSTKENHPLKSTTNQIQLIQANEQLIIFITSAPFRTSRRLSIRQTWLSLLVSNSVARGQSNIRTLIKNPSNSSSNLVIHYWFVCGHDTKQEVESAMEDESAVFGDILRLRYTESYSLLAFKTMSSLWLASVMDVQFIVKVDDDVYLHIPKMIWWLKTSSLPGKLYAGAVQEGVELKVIRNPKHKWFVSEQLLNDTLFPPYCNGPFYILSKSALLGLLNVSSNEGLTYFPLEDAYLGILAKRVGIAPLQLNRKHVLITGPRLRINLEDKKLNDFFALGHGLSIERMFELHARFAKLTTLIQL